MNLKQVVLGRVVQMICDIDGLSQRDLANKSGVNQSTLSRIFRGEGNPRFWDMVEISWALDSDLSYIVGSYEKVLKIARSKLQDDYFDIYEKFDTSNCATNLEPVDELAIKACIDWALYTVFSDQQENTAMK